MGFFRGVIRNISTATGAVFRGSSTESGRGPASNYWFNVLSAKTKSGQRVTPASAMAIATVFTCVKIYADTFFQLPQGLWRRIDDEHREPASDHPAWPLVTNMANPEMDARLFKSVLTGHCALTGDGFARIIRDGDGDPAELWPMNPTYVTTAREGGELVYYYAPPWMTKRQSYPARDIFHLKQFSWDGIHGVRPLEVLRETYGLAQGEREYASVTFANRGMLGGIASAPAGMSADDRKEFAEDFRSNFAGSRNAGKMMVLPGEWSYQSIGMPADDLQFLQTYKVTRAEIAGAFRIPAPMVNDLEHAHLSNAHELIDSYQRLSVAPWEQAWNSEVSRRLIAPADREAIIAEFDVSEFTRANIKDRTESQAALIMHAAMTPNEARRANHLPPLEGGDQLLAPLNMWPLSDLAAAAGSSSAKSEGDKADSSGSSSRGRAETSSSALARKRIRDNWRPVIEDAAERQTRGEIREIRKALKPVFGERSVSMRASAGDVRSALEELYAPDGGLVGFVRKTMAASLRGCQEAIIAQAVAEGGGQAMDGDAMIKSFLDIYTTRRAAQTIEELSMLAESLSTWVTDPSAAKAEASAIIEERLSAWVDGNIAMGTRAERIAHSEAVRSDGDMTRMTWKSQGHLKATWVAHGESCDACKFLNGRSIYIQDDEPFVPRGKQVGPDGIGEIINKPKASAAPDDGATRASQGAIKCGAPVLYPPLHEGGKNGGGVCDCSIRLG